MSAIHLFTPTKLADGTLKAAARKGILRLLLPLAALLLSMALAACGGAPAAAPAAGVGGPAALLTQDYPNAVGIQSQLLIGTFRLEGAANAVTTQQAAQLVPLWQMLRALSAGSGSQAEIDAVLGQIQRAMTADQLQAIRAMRLTAADNQALIQSLGITPLGTGAGGGQPGQGANLSDAEKATRRAEMGVTNQTGGSPVMLDKLIELLKRK